MHLTYELFKRASHNGAQADELDFAIRKKDESAATKALAITKYAPLPISLPSCW